MRRRSGLRKNAENNCAEQRRAVLVAPSPPEAGLSRAPPRQPERSAKGANCTPGIVIPKKTVLDA